MENETPSYYLVTGGAGFIASHLSVELVRRGHKVVVLDVLDYCSSLANLKEVEASSNFTFIKGDICDEELVRMLFSKYSIGAVLHFAALTHVDNSFGHAEEFQHVNVHGTRVLLEAARAAGIDLFLHASTDEVYGSKETCSNELSDCSPTNPYSVSKLAAEDAVLSYWQDYKLPVIITRSNNAYGPHQYPEKVIPKFICRLQKKQACCIHGSGMQKRNFLYVTDLVEAVIILLEKGCHGQVYNIGSELQMSIAGLAEDLVRRVVGDSVHRADHISFVTDRCVNDVGYPMDSSKLLSLGWRPRTTWNDGIDHTISWYAANFQNWTTTDSALSPHPS
ncbi:dTDP-D-glucose 4,6-dehydratase-like [Sycon ciliatum]|uniref:dTDP-D-glucose 4,6-dehydratase-like n=1 Tax=Sycon ciliatum TaxID=27933 RepID=UPI0031F63742